MSPKTAPPPRLSDLPLWRLLVALADAERAFGPANSTTRRLAQAVRDRLALGEGDATAATPKGGQHGR